MQTNVIIVYFFFLDADQSETTRRIEEKIKFKEQMTAAGQIAGNYSDEF